MKIGSTALGEVIHKLHTMMISKQLATQGGEKDVVYFALDGVDFSAGKIEFNNASGILHLSERHVHEVGADELALDESANALENLLYCFASENGRSELPSSHRRTDHVSVAKRKRIVHEACDCFARRVVHDLGWHAGTEFERAHGDALVKAVLFRARDTCKGMQAATLDMISLAASLRNAVILTRHAAPRVAKNTRRMQLIAGMPSMPSWLKNYARGDVVDNAWQVGKDVVGVVTRIPWRLSGVVLKMMCRGEEEKPMTTTADDDTDKQRRILWDDEDDDDANQTKVITTTSTPRRSKMMRDILAGGA